MSSTASVALARRPLFVWSVVWYLVFVAVTLMGVRVLVFLWPYPLLLCLQKWVPESVAAFVVAWVVGLGAVGGTGVLAQRLARPGRPDAVMAAVISLVLWFLPLLVIQLAAWGLAASMGWPYGE